MALLTLDVPEPIHGFPRESHCLQDNRPGVGMGQVRGKAVKSQDIKK